MLKETIRVNNFVTKKKAPNSFSDKKIAIWVAGFFLILGVIIYSNTWHAPFELDDDARILKNNSVHDIRNISAIWKENMKTRFLPNLSFAVNYTLGQDQVLGYHLVNVAQHVLNAFLVYYLIILLLSAPKVQRCYAEDARQFIAVLSGLVFLAHPLQTQAVTYIVQRMSSMSAFFYLFAIIFYLHARIKNKNLFFLPSVLMVVGAMFCKETAITLPIAILLIEGLFFSPFEEKKKFIFRCLLFGSTFFIIPYLISLRMSRSESVPDVLTVKDYFLTQLNVICTYLRLFVLPINQNLDYDYPTAHSLLEVRVAFSALILFSLILLGWFLRKRNPLIAFSLFWFFLTLAPESSFVPISDVINEHRMYVPLLGCAIFLAGGLHFVFSKNKTALS